MFDPENDVPAHERMTILSSYDRSHVIARRTNDPVVSNGSGASAAEFRALVAAYERLEQEARHNSVAEKRRRREEEVKALLRASLSDEEWLSMLDKARLSAARGATRCVIFSFPALLCSDSGRAVNLPDPEWPKTLRGKAASVFLLWEAELKPHGFVLAAQVANFPDGVPGDVELSLVWGR